MSVDPRLVRQAGDRHPLHDGGLAERVGVDALDEEDRLGDVRDEHRGLLAGDAEQHLVGEPLDHRVQVAQVGDVRPERLGLPGLVELALGQLPVEGHLHPLGDVVLLQVGRRQDRRAAAPGRPAARRRASRRRRRRAAPGRRSPGPRGRTPRSRRTARARRRAAARRRRAGRRRRRAGRRGSHRPRCAASIDSSTVFPASRSLTRRSSSLLGGELAGDRLRRCRGCGAPVSSRCSSFSATVVSSLAPSVCGGEDQRGELAAGVPARSGRCGRCAARCGSATTAGRSGSGGGTGGAGSRPRRPRRR